MKILKSYLPSGRVRYLFAGIGLTLVPFGPVQDLVKVQNPWRGFSYKGPVLRIYRVQKVSIVQGNPNCEAWVSALEKDAEGRLLSSLTPEAWTEARKDWEPRRKEDVEAVTDCDDFPCLVKLDRKETQVMSKVPEVQRMSTYYTIILDRLKRYEKTQERKEYEFKGDPIDPWKEFEHLGLVTPLKISPKMELRARMLDLAPDKVKAVRQVLDSRVAVAKDRRRANLWRRDIYTDHYFDSWGEWTDISCEIEQGNAWITQAVVLELDLLKNTDFLSRISRSKIRNAIQESGTVYLNEWFRKIRNRAESIK